MKRSVLNFLCAVITAAYAVSGSAQPFPNKPVRVIVPFPPGGGGDFLARVTQERFSAELGQPVIIENKPGAGGLIGTDSVAKAAPDGYTLVLGNIGTHAINQAIYKKLPYQTATDFVPITHATNVVYAIAVGPKQIAVKSLADLFRVARQQQGGLNFGSGGNGSGPHMGGELLKLHAKVPMVHVPYKGGAPMMTDLLGGHLDVLVADLPTLMPQLKQGGVRLLALTSNNRLALFPDVPTTAEAGLPGMEMYAWQALFAPAGTPPEVVQRLHAAFTAALKAEDVSSKLVASGSQVVASSPAGLAAFQAQELRKWQELVKSAGIELQ
ncbi:MAG: tripartite tricarboxylate transporter substrate binding protein [Pseudomonadota bacterium]|nr:tripartite tricarboxylate transporter substrate binding protein [Pseudomonadota bacterium]